MKKTLILMFSLMVASCGDSDDGDDNSNSIVGSWSYTYPSVQCTEIYSFKADNTFTVTSLDEIYGGTYSLSDDVNSSDRQEFSITITSDNQQADCEGDMESDAGVTAELYIEFVSPIVMDWYLEPTGGTASITLKKD